MGRERWLVWRAALAAVVILAAWLAPARPAIAGPGLKRLNHIIILVQENHSFDNYLGALPYAPGSPYHAGHCRTGDHACVDGLDCARRGGELLCANANRGLDGRIVRAFHSPTRCTAPDIDHEWPGSHLDISFEDPRHTLGARSNDGFVRQNDIMAPDTHRTGPADGGRAMAFFDERDIGFYYALAETFAISDRYFSPALGPTDINRAYLVAGTSFGHLTFEDLLPPRPDGFKPLGGTIYSLMTARGVDWAESYQDVPEGFAFLRFGSLTDPTKNDPHFITHQELLDRLAGKPGTKPLPSVVFVNGAVGYPDRHRENDEHPSTDIQRGQAWVSAVIATLRAGPYWRDSALLLTYDESGGYYDHVVPPRAPQGGARTPDGIEPGRCADASNLPASGRPGGGANCPTMLKPGSTAHEASVICPEYAADPSRPYPADCPTFDQLGFRLPLIVVSPFAKPAYVSHVVADHTSLLALIEARFLTDANGRTQHLTQRDAHAATLEDMFDFARAPSLAANVPPPAPPPALDCTPA